MKFERVKALSLATISLKGMKKGDKKFFKILEESPRVVDDLDKEGKPREEDGKKIQLNLLKVLDLETGEEGEIVLPFLVFKALSELDNLKGLNFEMVKGAKVNRTVLWSVYEVQPEK